LTSLFPPSGEKVEGPADPDTGGRTEERFTPPSHMVITWGGGWTRGLIPAAATGVHNPGTVAHGVRPSPPPQRGSTHCGTSCVRSSKTSWPTGPSPPPPPPHRGVRWGRRPGPGLWARAAAGGWAAPCALPPCPAPRKQASGRAPSDRSPTPRPAKPSWDDHSAPGCCHARFSLDPVARREGGRQAIEPRTTHQVGGPDLPAG